MVINSSIPSGEYEVLLNGFGVDESILLDETQKNLMMQGELYDSTDPLLVRDRDLVHQKLLFFNNCLDSRLRDTTLISNILHPESAKNPEPHFEPPFHCDYGYNIKVGKKFYANFACVILDCAPITIGNNVKFGPGVHIYAATHPLDSVTRRDVEYAKAVHIGNDVWIGGGVKILPGVVIGDCCVIGAGSVVSKDIPSNSLAVGVPAHVINQIS